MASPSSSSGSDSDDLREDLEALRRACMISGVSPAGLPSFPRSGGYREAQISDDDDSGPDADIELLRSLQDRFSSSALRPASSSSPPQSFSDSDDKDDLATLRAIQTRFARYENKSVDVKEGYDDANVASSDRLVRSQLPKAARLLVEALKKNRALQKFIRKKMIEIEARMEQNKGLKERLKCLMDFQVSSKRAATCMLLKREDPRVLLLSPRIVEEASDAKEKKEGSRKASALNFGPENPHASDYNMVMRRFPLSLSRKTWSGVEKETIWKGLKQQYQEMVMLNSINSESCADTPFMLPLSSSFYEVTPEKIRNFLSLVNWDRLACMYLAGRSGPECETRWLNWEDPLINHEPWTLLEDKKLLFIIQENGIFNWINIATELGTQRTPFQCLSRYQRSLNPNIVKKNWTQYDDEQLMDTVESYGDKNWPWIASFLEGRTGRQCSERWRKVLNPDRKRVGRWSIDEDKNLQVAVMLFGAKNWNKIAKFAPGRTQVQCRERWVNSLDPSLIKTPWSTEEDGKLLAAIDLHGHCWSKVAACLSPRTDSQCLRRWKALRPDEALLQKAVRRMKKSVLPNFSDRKKERTLVGPNDFISVASDRPVNENMNIVKKKRGRPRKQKDNPVQSECWSPGPSDIIQATSPAGGDIPSSLAPNEDMNIVKKKRGRPRKLDNPVQSERGRPAGPSDIIQATSPAGGDIPSTLVRNEDMNIVKKKRGRPRKQKENPVQSECASPAGPSEIIQATSPAGDDIPSSLARNECVGRANRGGSRTGRRYRRNDFVEGECESPLAGSNDTILALRSLGFVLNSRRAKGKLSRNVSPKTVCVESRSSQGEEPIQDIDAATEDPEG